MVTFVDGTDLDRTGIVYTSNNRGGYATDKEDALALVRHMTASMGDGKYRGIPWEANVPPDLIEARNFMFFNGQASRFIRIINDENLATKMNEMIEKVNEIEIWKAKGRQATAERHAKANANAKRGTRKTEPRNSRPNTQQKA
uniref:Uncharacterized protein n=1 Tax=viral metagenome TaxID=1070528 RepID=A0A6C0EXR0_9ZZZZ